jgi:hypothetical protein
MKTIGGALTSSDCPKCLSTQQKTTPLTRVCIIPREYPRADSDG